MSSASFKALRTFLNIDLEIVLSVDWTLERVIVYLKDG